jgi:hypothetical protein
MLGPARDADSTHCLVCARETEPSYTRCRGLSNCSFCGGSDGTCRKRSGRRRQEANELSSIASTPAPPAGVNGNQNRTCVCCVTGSGDTSDVIQDLEEKRLRQRGELCAECPSDRVCCRYFLSELIPYLVPDCRGTDATPYLNAPWSKHLLDFVSLLN